MNAVSGLSPEEKAGLAESLVRRLMPGAELGFRVTAGKRNKFELAALGRDGRARTVMIKNEKTAAKYGPCPKAVPVKEISDETARLFPKFVLPSGFLTAASLESDYGVPRSKSAAAAFDAVLRRVNSRGAVLELYDFFDGRWRAVASVRCGESAAEAALKMAV